MTKNWLRYVSGSWTLSSGTEPLGKRTWIEHGISYIDPSAVTCVNANGNPTPCVVIGMKCGRHIVTREKSAAEIIADIQSALP